ncbi:MAG: penicillin-binding protein 1C [Fulvivirga sp.]
MKIGKAGSIMLLAFLILFLFIPLPDPLFDVPYATTLKSDDGTLLSAAIADDQQWRFPVSDSIPAKLESALLLFEDEYFYYHPGVNPVSLFRAARQNFNAGKTVSGGSTLTMQTVRMALGNQPRTYTQKLLEMAIALKMELFHKKSSILKQYVDHAPYGGNIVGVSAASYRFFGRPPDQLSWAEAATLVILPNNPASIFPGKNQAAFLKKRDHLLDKIHNRGLIDKDELFLAKQEPLPQNIKPIPNKAYHLLYRAMGEGLKGKDIKSTLDARLQMAADKLVNEHSKSLSFNQIHNAAAIVLDIRSGNTLAYVGNSNASGTHGQHVDIITSRRSPGSLLKPFLYAAALDENLIAPRELLPDVPVFYKGFAPKNFDKEYRGAVPADDALISSLNVPFVHLLIEYGYEKFHQKLKQLGFNAFDQPASHYGLSMILGGAETTLWELTSVYAGMARSLDNYKERPIGKVYSAQDYHYNHYLKADDVDDVSLTADGFLRAPSIRFTFDAMQKLNRPDEESGWQQFQSSRQIAWKTGTSYGFRDGWAIGLNNDHVIGVWVGNADGEGRPGLTGVSVAAPLLFRLFDLVDGNVDLGEPFGVARDICTESGMLASKQCLSTKLVQLPDYLLKTESCAFHTLLHLDKQGKYQVNNTCYNVSDIVQQPWFVLPPVQAWYYRKFHPNYKKQPPFMPGCLQVDSKTHFELIYPNQFTKVKIPLEQSGEKGFSIFEAAHQNMNAVVYWHLDDQYLGYTEGTHQKGIQADVGLHTITLVDEFGNEISQRFEVIE